MDGVFWHDEFGFVVDPHHMPSRFPAAQPFELLRFDERLSSSGKLPRLNQSPVASWLVARLFQLTRERLCYETVHQCFNDGGGYWLNFISFTRELKPLAFLNLHANSSRVQLWGTCSDDIAPSTVINAFVGALMAQPDDLMICKWTITDSDPPDRDKRRFGDTNIFGWDGSKFLGVSRPSDNDNTSTPGE